MLERSGPAIYNIVNDEPAPVRAWLPVPADALGAKPPRHVPAWLARLFAGRAAVVMATQVRGASNAKAKRELGWTPRYPSWRLGFPVTYPAIAAAGWHAPGRGTGPGARLSRARGRRCVMAARPRARRWGSYRPATRSPAAGMPS
ncbi:MAG: hypothetical protein QOG05_115 [Streptosporangiaceae bacterium]|nr:hypothetical protein [Streptosporangiaceae bacterium]